MAAYRVLVVDDNHEVRRMVTATIKTLGAEIDVLDVPSAEEALFISSSLPLDLVVLDFRLPGMSGIEMVTRLRKRKPETKIILVTGIEDATIRQQVSQANVAAYFFKPIEIATFLAAVRRCLWSDQSGEPSVSGAPSVRGAPSIGSVDLPPDAKRQAVTAPPTSAKREPSASVIKPAPMQGFQPTLGERLTALCQQVSAITAILVNETGQVQEETGNVAEITADPALLPALMQAFHASQAVSDTLGKGQAEGLLCFTNDRQRIYLAPVDPSHALLVVISGYFEPDRLGMLDRAIHLAMHDLQAILEHMREQASLTPVQAEAEQAGLPPEVTVDQEILAGVEDIFSQAPKEVSKEEADDFWETLRENGEMDGTHGKDVLSYDQARDMGLAPDDGEQP